MWVGWRKFKNWSPDLSEYYWNDLTQNLRVTALQLKG